MRQNSPRQNSTLTRRQSGEGSSTKVAQRQNRNFVLIQALGFILTYFRALAYFTYQITSVGDICSILRRMNWTNRLQAIKPAVDVRKWSSSCFFLIQILAEFVFPSLFLLSYILHRRKHVRRATAAVGVNEERSPSYINITRIPGRVVRFTTGDLRSSLFFKKWVVVPEKCVFPNFSVKRLAYSCILYIFFKC